PGGELPVPPRRSAGGRRHRRHRRPAEQPLMLVGRVVGNVVATQKNEKLEGSKLLLVQPLDLAGAPRGAGGLAIAGGAPGPGAPRSWSSAAAWPRWTPP